MTQCHYEHNRYPLFKWSNNINAYQYYHYSYAAVTRALTFAELYMISTIFLTYIHFLFACYGELIIHSWSWWLLAGMERLVDKLIWNKYASSISNSVSQLLSAVVYSDRRCNFHICYCQAKWSSKWLSCKNRMTKKLCVIIEQNRLVLC